MNWLKSKTLTLLRYSERYTKTDMVYLAKSGLWLNLATITVSLFSLVLYMVFARVLTPETYGHYQYILSAGALIGALSLSGMNSAVTRAVAQGQTGILKKSVSVQLLWGLLPFCIAGGISAYYLFQNNLALSIGFLLIALFVPVTNAFNTYSAFLAGKKDFRRVFLYNFCINILFYSSLIISAFITQSALILVAISLGTQFIGCYVAYRKVLHVYKTQDTEDGDTITYGKHLSAMNVLGQVALQIDSFFVFHFLGAAPLALYTFATAIPDRLSGLFKFIPFALLPALSQKNTHAIRTAVSWHKMLWVFGSIVCVGVLYVVLAPFAFSLLFPTYSVSVPFSQLYALSMVSIIGNIFTNALIAERNITSLYIFNTAMPIVQIVLMFVGIITFGLIGIIVAKILSVFLLIALASYFIFHTKHSSKVTSVLLP